MEATMEFPGVVMKKGKMRGLWRGPFTLRFMPDIGVTPDLQDGYDATDKRYQKWNIRQPISATEVAWGLRLVVGEERIAKTWDEYFTMSENRVNALWVELAIRQQFPQGTPDEVADAAVAVFPECYTEYWKGVFSIEGKKIEDYERNNE